MILKFLKESKVVKSFFVKDLKTFTNGFYIKVSVKLIDNSDLFITEYVDEEERNYTYHWQDENKEMILRWDNAPYHKNISTFPHHSHKPDGIFESFDITLNDIFKIIENIILR